MNPLGELLNHKLGTLITKPPRIYFEGTAFNLKQLLYCT